MAQAEETCKRLLSAHTKDPGVRFEETGIDHVFVDEAHLFKNRRVVTEIDGIAHQGSKRAQDLDAKLWALRQRHGPRTVTFATATPVANSIAELWVMQSYLQPDVLQAAGVRSFNAWSANFGRTHTALELTPDGSGFRMKTRFARFQNIPELLGLYHQVADVRTAEDLNLPVPALARGQPQTLVVEGSDTLRDYVLGLAERAEAVRGGQVDPAREVSEPAGFLVKTRQWFGSGTSAHHRVLVAQDTRQALDAEMVRGASFRPVAEVGLRGRPG